MQVQVSSPTTFWVVDLARQLERLGCLERFCTGLPNSMTRGVPAAKTRRQQLLLAPEFLARLSGSRWVRDILDGVTRQAFERWLCRNIAPCDVFHCLSSFGLSAHRRAKARFGSLTVCDRGSSHIRFQDDLLREEFSRWGVPYRAISDAILEQEEREYEECDLITVPSSFARSSFIARGVLSHKVVRVPYGVDLEQFGPVAKTDDVFRIIYVGQLSLRKGIPYLLEAVRDLRVKNVETLLIGTLSDEIKPILERYAGTFRYLGPKPRHELSNYYSQGSVFVLASIEEGLAMVQAQAMACGLPVIATTNTGAEDLFTDGVEGFVVPIRDAAAIRERLLYLYENPGVRARMSAAAMDRVRFLGGWNAYGESVVRAYREAAHTSTRAMAAIPVESLS